MPPEKSSVAGAVRLEPAVVLPGPVVGVVSEELLGLEVPALGGRPGLPGDCGTGVVTTCAKPAPEASISEAPNIVARIRGVIICCVLVKAGVYPGNSYKPQQRLESCPSPYSNQPKTTHRARNRGVRPALIRQPM